MMRFALVALATLITVDAYAQAPLQNQRWNDMTRSAADLGLYGWSANASTPTSAAYLEDQNDEKLVILWETQVEVSCAGDAGELAMFCWSMDAGFDFESEPSMGGGGTCDGGCSVFDDSSGPSGKEGPMPCFVVKANDTKYRWLPRARWYGSTPTPPTYRVGRCTGAVSANGANAPCDTDEECGSGTCTKDSVMPKGVFLSGQATDTSLVCQVELTL